MHPSGRIFVRAQLATVSSTTFTQYSSDGMGNNCPKQATIFALTTGSKMFCALKCRTKPGCKNFDYNKMTKSCIGCRESCNKVISDGGPEGGQCWKTKDEFASSCYDHLRQSGATKDTVYSIKTDFESLYDVFCLNYEIPLDPGWTVFMRRTGASLLFNRSFLEYENGFGDVHGDHWRGLRFLHEMTSHTKTDVLFIIVEQFSNTEGMVKDGHEIFSNFKVGPSPGYRLSVGKMLEIEEGLDTVTFFNVSNNSPFSTMDKDHSKSGCSAKRGYGGWWWNERCLSLNPTGPYTEPSTDQDIGYGKVRELTIALRRSL